MTTIAISATHIAYDSQLTSGFTKHVCALEKVQPRYGKIFAFAGDVQMFKPAMKWVRDGAPPKKVPPGSWEMIVCGKKGFRYYADYTPYGVDVVPPVALGSGTELAIGAMQHGATPFKAVKAAAKRDCFTGFDIKGLGIKETLRKERKRWKAKKRAKKEKKMKAKAAKKAKKKTKPKKKGY